MSAQHPFDAPWPRRIPRDIDSAVERSARAVPYRVPYAISGTPARERSSLAATYRAQHLTLSLPTGDVELQPLAPGDPPHRSAGAASQVPDDSVSAGAVPRVPDGIVIPLAPAGNQMTLAACEEVVWRNRAGLTAHGLEPLSAVVRASD